MSRFNTVELIEGESFPVKALVKNQDTFENVLTAEIAELRLLVFDMDGANPSEPLYPDQLTVGDHWFDSEQTEGWRGPGGYNFKDVIPGHHFEVEGGHRYKARHELTLNDGTFMVIAETTVHVRERW